DLTLGGVTTDRLNPGESERLDVGVVSQDLNGWCTVAGHRQMGMVFDVEATDAEAGSGEGTGESSSAVVENVVDPALPPLSEQREQHITLPVEEVPLEVAPGVWQQRWTFGGTVPGPTLHGRVGDKFVITLVNDGAMGH